MNILGTCQARADKEIEALKRKTSFMDEYVGFSDAVTTESDAQKVLFFFKKLGEEKEVRARVEQQQQEDQSEAGIGLGSARG